MLQNRNPQTKVTSRRETLKLLGAGAAAVGLGALGNPLRQASAQASPTFAEQEAFYRFKIGSINATLINDGTLVLPTTFWGANVTPEAVVEFLQGYNLPPEIATVPNTNLLLDTGRERILIDTGLGRYAFPGAAPNSGKLLPTLELLGVTPDSVDTVFLTHGHPDHIGALTDGSGNPTFPNARHLLHQIDWDFWTGDAPADDPFTAFFFQVAAENLAPLGDRVERFEGEVEIAPGIRTVEAFGHTPGHTGLLIESGGERLLSMGDNASHHKMSFERPDWLSSVEVNPEQARETKERLLDFVATEKIKTFGDHHPFPGLGYVARNPLGKRWVWTPGG